MFCFLRNDKPKSRITWKGNGYKEWRGLPWYLIKARHLHTWETFSAFLHTYKEGNPIFGEI